VQSVYRARLHLHELHRRTETDVFSPNQDLRALVQEQAQDARCVLGAGGAVSEWGQRSPALKGQG
jgi:hypothetical protein